LWLCSGRNAGSILLVPNTRSKPSTNTAFLKAAGWLRVESLDVNPAPKADSILYLETKNE
jgi:hypothetical protein